MLKVEESQFQALFPAYSKAHGTSAIRGIEPKTGKRKAAYTTEAYPASDRVWAEHFSGGPKGLGIIPLLDDGISVQWAAIDIDVNDIDHARLEAKAVELGLPLVICRSKSGGAHCYLFLEQPCPAK
jgi:hypothetical protein